MPSVRSLTSRLTELTTEVLTLTRNQVSTVYPTDSASRAETKSIARSTTTPTIVLPTYDQRDAEIAKLANLVQNLYQENAKTAALVGKVEQEAAQKCEREVAHQRTSLGNSISHLEMNLRDSLARSR
eukprot:4044132-Amphidinium_carterae.3